MVARDSHSARVWDMLAFEKITCPEAGGSGGIINDAKSREAGKKNVALMAPAPHAAGGKENHK